MTLLASKFGSKPIRTLSEDVRDYFSAMAKHIIPFSSTQDGDRELIDLAFSKKAWLRQFRVRSSPTILLFCRAGQLNLAQDYIGSNNLNLLLPNGQYGARDQGGPRLAALRLYRARTHHMHDLPPSGRSAAQLSERRQRPG
jgi:hypothetical protein